MAKVEAWDDKAERTVFPDFHGRFISSDRMTFALWNIDAGAVLPEHAHEHEQVVHMLEGEFELTFGGATYRCVAGEVLAIPSNARHSGRAITACRIMDVFAPVRQDYL